MRIKSYFAQSVHEAMEKARFELGPEAMLLTSKKAAEPTSLGAYEVVFGLSNENRTSEPPSKAPPSEPSNSVGEQLSQLRRQIESMQRSMARQTMNGTEVGAPDRDDLIERLVAAEFSHDLAEKLVCAVLEPSQPVQNQIPQARRPIESSGQLRSFTSPPESTPNLSVSESLLDEIEKRVNIDSTLGVSGRAHRVSLLVGPPGSGKTTTLVKLAIRQGLAQRVPVHILSLDTLRVGAADQLSAYCKIMGASFLTVSSTGALEQALEGIGSKKLILIDTPGLGSDDAEEMDELAAFAENHPEVDVQLVLPATLRMSAATSALRRFGALRPAKLLFTHVDEANGPGCILEPAIRSGLPISFIANGQQIPEDIGETSKAALREQLTPYLGENTESAD